MRHVLVVGILGLIAWIGWGRLSPSRRPTWPDWYPIAVALTGFPCVWLGGVLHGPVALRG
jgi:hypothetical protein